MARPGKSNLDYFPLDVDFFNDPKIAAVRSEFGLKGESVFIHLLCAIYKNSYFVLWDEPTRLMLLGELPGVSDILLDRVIARLLRWRVFDETLFKSVRVLTSKAIQYRYFSITKRRSNDVDLSYLLIDISGVGGTMDNSGINVYNNSVNVCNNSLKENKRKENINNNNSLSNSPSLESGGLSSAERESFLSIFFFKGFANPLQEVDNFINHYEAREWIPNGQKRPITTFKGRMALARNWAPKTGDNRFPDCADCLKWLQKGYFQTLEKYGAAYAGTIIRDITTIRKISGSPGKFQVYTTESVFRLFKALNYPYSDGVTEIQWKKSQKQMQSESNNNNDKTGQI